MIVFVISPACKVHHIIFGSSTVFHTVIL